RGLREAATRLVDDGLEILHRSSSGTKKGGPRASFCFVLRPYALRLAFAWPAIFSNAALSNTAMSARTLRSTSTEAFFRPLMSVLYVRPNSRAAALMRTIHRARKSRFLLRRSR